MPASAARSTMTLPEGTVALEIPKGLSSKSYSALKSWVELVVSLAKPNEIDWDSPPDNEEAAN